MMRGVGGVRKSIDQSWLAKGLGLGFKGVQEEISSEETSTYASDEKQSCLFYSSSRLGNEVSCPSQWSKESEIYLF